MSNSSSIIEKSGSQSQKKDLNQAFLEDTEEPADVKSPSDYTYCACYGSFIAEIDEPEIDLYMLATVKAHGDIKTLNLDSDCACPACLGHINQCPECNGIYLVLGITEGYMYEEAEEAVESEKYDVADDDDQCGPYLSHKTEAIDPKIEAIMKATQAWSLKTMDEEEPMVATMRPLKKLTVSQATIISTCWR